MTRVRASTTASLRPPSAGEVAVAAPRCTLGPPPGETEKQHGERHGSRGRGRLFGELVKPFVLDHKSAPGGGPMEPGCLDGAGCLDGLVQAWK